MKAIVVGVIAFALVACGRTADSTEAGVRLTITRDASLDIATVRVRALDGDREVVEEVREAGEGMLGATETLPLVFRGAPDGAEVRIEVEGLAGADVIAAGETTAKLRRGTFVDAEVHLGADGGGAGGDGGLDGGATDGPDAGADAATGTDAGMDAGADAGTTACSPDGKTRACGMTDVGECKKGTQTCTDGAWGACKGEVEATDEACPADGKDQDCNGTDDDGDNTCGGVCTLASEPGDWCDAPEDATGDADDCADDTLGCNGLNAVECVEGTPGLVEWAVNVGDVQSDQLLAIDAADDGSLFATGIFNKDPAGATEIGGHPIDTFASLDVLVVRVDPNDGSVVWAAGAGGGDVDYGFGVAAARDASAVYVTGEYGDGLADFGARTLMDTDMLSSTYFLAKYEGADSGGDGDLNVLWAVDAGGTGADTGRAVAVAPDGSIYVTGVLGGVADVAFGNDAGGNPVTLKQPCNGDAQMFLAKYDTNGKPVWVAGTASSSTSDSASATGYGVDVDDAGNVYVTGTFSGLQLRFCDADAARACPETLCPEVLTSQDHMTSGNYTSDVFVARYDADGNVQWATRAGQPSNANPDTEVGLDVASDGSNVYVTGYFDGFTIAFCELPDAPCDLDDTVDAYGTQDMFVAAFGATSGAFQWARNAGASSKVTIGYAIGLEDDGSLRVAGSFQANTMAAFGLVGEDCYTQVASASTTNNDVFIARYEPNGDLRWVRRAGGSGTDEARGIAVRPGGDAFVVGLFNGASVPFCHDAAGCTVTASSAAQDGFVARFGR